MSSNLQSGYGAAVGSDPFATAVAEADEDLYDPLGKLRYLHFHSLVHLSDFGPNCPNLYFLASPLSS